MTKVLLATDKPFASVAVQGIQKICDEAGFELVKLESYTKKEELLQAVSVITSYSIHYTKLYEIL